MLVLPAIALRHEDIQIGERRYYRRKEGDILQPERESLDDLERQRLRMGPDAWAAQYQQQPVPPGGVLIKREKIKR